MKLRGTWLNSWLFCFGVLAVGGTSTQAEDIIVLVSGNKPVVAPAAPARPQVVKESSNPTTTVITAEPATPQPTANTGVEINPQQPAAVPAQPAAVPAQPVVRKLSELDTLVDEAVAVTSRRYLTADVHTPWQIFHGLIALRQNFKLKVDGQKVSALEWIRGGRFYKGLPLVEQTPYGGRFHTFTEPYAFEGHPNQFLAILAMSELPRDFTFKAGANGAVISVDDMLRHAQAECNDREEITWTLWLFSRYFPHNAQWQNKYGEQWSMERLVQTQTNQRVQDGACGGCHGLFAICLARNAYQQSGGQLRGVWFEADQKIRRYVAETKALQNLHIDGSFSSNHYNGPGYDSDFGKRIAASGHILEWLMIGLDNRELQEPWLQRGVESVARDLINNRQAPADCGPLYHALHSLVLYRQRTRPGLADPTLVEAAPVPVVTPQPKIPATVGEPPKVEVKPAIPAKPEVLPPMPEAKAVIETPAAPQKVATPKAEAPKVEATKPATTGETAPAKPPVELPAPKELPKAEPTAPTAATKPKEPTKPEEKPAATPKAEKAPTEKPKTDDKDEFDGEFQVPLPPTDD